MKILIILITLLINNPCFAIHLYFQSDIPKFDRIGENGTYVFPELKAMNKNYLTSQGNKNEKKYNKCHHSKYHRKYECSGK